MRIQETCFLSILGFFCLVFNAYAIPTTYSDTVGPVGFANGTTVTVYIQADPLASDPDTPRNRVPSAEKGITAWKDSLKDYGNITLKVVKLDTNGNDPSTGKPPDLTVAGTVKAVWETAQQFKDAGKENADAYANEPDREGTDLTRGKTAVITDARFTTGGVIHLRQEASGIEAKDNGIAAINAVHEMGHILGLAHENKNDVVMNPKQELQNGGVLTEADKDELKQVYQRTSSSVSIQVTPPLATCLACYYTYDYTLGYISGPELGLFQISLDSSFDFVTPSAPEGWQAYISGTEGVADDVIQSYLSDLPGIVGTFRVTVLNDSVQYLGPSNPSLTFSFSSPNPPSSRFGWSGNLVELAGPTAIPEPPSLGLVGGGLGCLLFTYVQRRRRKALA